MKKKPKEYRIVKNTAQDKLVYEEVYYTVEETKQCCWWGRKAIKWVEHKGIRYFREGNLYTPRPYKVEFTDLKSALKYLDYLRKDPKEKTIYYKGVIIEEVILGFLSSIPLLYIIKSNPFYISPENCFIKRAYEGSENLTWLKQQIAKKVDKLEEINITSEVVE